MVNLPTLNKHDSKNMPQKETRASSNASSFNIIIVATIAITAISWIIAFAGSIAASQTMSYFPKFTWWGLVFQLFVVIGLPVLYFFNMIYLYYNFIMVVLSIAFVYTSNSTNNFVYYTDSSSSAAGTGFILLSIANFLWLLYLGSDPDAPMISSLSGYGGPSHPLKTRRRINSFGPSTQRASTANYNYSRGNQSSARLNYNDDLYSNMEDSHELAGFENPVTSTKDFAIDDNVNSADLNTDQEFNDSAYRASGIIPPMNEGTNFTGISSVTNYMEAYPILVRALYDYNASPDDVNELSFKKGDIFRVKNTNGNWWQAKNKRGEIGMCPSNYLEIVT